MERLFTFALLNLLLCNDLDDVKRTKARALVLFGPTFGIPLYGQAQENGELTSSHAQCAYLDPRDGIHSSFYPSQPIYAAAANSFRQKNDHVLLIGDDKSLVNLHCLVVLTSISQVQKSGASLEQLTEMPREFRKRGRGGTKNNKPPATAGEDYPDAACPEDVTGIPLESSIHLALGGSQIEASTVTEAYPVDAFPLLTPDQRAYWKEIDEKLQEFERLGLDSYHSRPKNPTQQVEEDEDEEDERKLLLRTALAELGGQELALACDPETAVILERIIFCMDGFAMRVLLDRLIERFVDLCHHRNASHALQSLLAVSASVLEEEAQLENSSKPDIPNTEADLPTMNALLCQACEDMSNHLESLASSPSACHVLLTILLLSFGKTVDPESYRSKKSKQWRSKQAPFHKPKESQPPVLANGHENKSLSANQRKVPEQLRRKGDSLYSQLRKNWCDHNGIIARSMISNAATVVLLRLTIELEFDKGEAEIPGSLTDIVLGGLFQISKSAQSRSDFVEVSLRDMIASRVIEGILGRLSPASYAQFHHVYLVGRLGHLCAHPVANFVITKAVSRLDREAFLPALEEFKPKMADCIDNYRTGFLKALVEQSVCFGEKVQEEVIQTILKAFGIESESEYRWIFPCLISLMRLDYLRKTTVYNQLEKNPKTSQGELKLPESNMQGSLLLQAIQSNMPGTVNKIISRGISELPLELVIAFSRDPTSSRVLDSFLNSPSINHLARYRFILRFIGKFHELADDRIGSRVAESCWTVSDVYLKEKIATSLVEHQIFLQKSSYGHYFLKKLELPLFERQRTAWKEKMASQYQLPNSTSNKTPNQKVPTQEIPTQKASQSQYNPSSPPSTNSDSKNELSSKISIKKDHDENVPIVQQKSLKRKHRKSKPDDSDVVPPLSSVIDHVFHNVSGEKLDQKKKKKKTKPK